MKFKFVPEICRGDNAEYSGYIEIEIPKAHERHRYIRESGILGSIKESDGRPDSKEKVKFDLAENYDFVVNFMEKIEKHLVSVSLVRKSDGMEISSPDEFICVKSCEPAIMEIVTMFMEGFEPSKNSKAL